MEDDAADLSKKGSLKNVWHKAHTYLMPFAMFTIGLSLIAATGGAAAAAGGGMALLDPFGTIPSMFIPSLDGLMHVGDYVSSSIEHASNGVFWTDHISTAFNAHSSHAGHLASAGTGLDVASHAGHAVQNGVSPLLEGVTGHAEHLAACGAEPFGEWMNSLSGEEFEFNKALATDFAGGNLYEHFANNFCHH